MRNVPQTEVQTNQCSVLLLDLRFTTWHVSFLCMNSDENSRPEARYDDKDDNDGENRDRPDDKDDSDHDKHDEKENDNKRAR